MALFLSTFTNKIDKKGRVSVPAPFRTALGEHIAQGIVFFASHQHPCLEGFDWAKMNELGDRMDHYDLFSDEQDDLATTIFGQSVHLYLDGEGRVVLPDHLIKEAGLEEQVTFVGLGRKFQIWNPELYERRHAQAVSAVQNKKLTLPQKNREAS